MFLFNFIRLTYVSVSLFRSGIFKIFHEQYSYQTTKTEKIICGKKIRVTLEKLGPLYIKIGQLLSTRTDIIPKEVADELSLLRDDAAPIDYSEILKTLNKCYGRDIGKVFKEFNKIQIASASIAQIHKAITLEGNNVVAVKIVRPGIKKQILRDIRAIKMAASLAQRFFRFIPFLQLKKVINTIETIMLQETDMQREAAMASQLKRNLKDYDMVHIPKIYWEYTCRDILVMEYVSGIQIDKKDILDKYNIDIKKLIENGVELFCKQVFVDGFFHGDLHPGNILVTEEGNLNIVDFGLIGTLNNKERYFLAQIFFNVFKKDYSGIAFFLKKAEIIPDHVQIKDIELALRIAIEPIIDLKIDNISYGNVLSRLINAIEGYTVNIPMYLISFQKSLINLEGICKVLYPELDLLKIAEPIMKSILNTRYTISNIANDFKNNLVSDPFIISEFPFEFYKTLCNINKLVEKNLGNNSD